MFSGLVSMSWSHRAETWRGGNLPYYREDSTVLLRASFWLLQKDDTACIYLFISLNLPLVVWWKHVVWNTCCGTIGSRLENKRMMMICCNRKRKSQAVLRARMRTVILQRIPNPSRYCRLQPVGEGTDCWFIHMDLSAWFQNGFTAAFKSTFCTDKVVRIRMFLTWSGKSKLQHFRKKNVTS